MASANTYSIVFDNTRFSHYRFKIMKQHQCQYAGGYCIHCLARQPTIRNGKEVKLSDIKYSDKIAYKPKSKRITSKFQYNTQLLLDCLGVSTKEFPKYCAFVKRIGVKNIYKVIKDIESADKWCRETHHQPLKRVGFFINKYVKK